MIDFFCKFDYVLEQSDILQPMDLSAPLDYLVSSTRTPTAAPRSFLQADADIYTLADKYDIPDLKVLAKEKFESRAKELVSLANTTSENIGITTFIALIPYVYTHTAPNEEGLRSSIVQIWRLAPDKINTTLGDVRLHSLVRRSPDLAMDLIKGLVTAADVAAESPERYDYGYPQDGYSSRAGYATYEQSGLEKLARPRQEPSSGGRGGFAGRWGARYYDAPPAPFGAHLFGNAPTPAQYSSVSTFPIHPAARPTQSTTGSRADGNND